MRRLVTVFLLALVALAGLVAWLAGREASLRWALNQVSTASQGRLHMEGISGNLLGSLRVRDARLATPDIAAHAHDLRLQFSLLDLLQKRLHIQHLAIARINLNLTPDDEPARLPEHLTLPVGLSIDRLLVGRLDIARGERRIALSDLDAGLSSDGRRHRLRLTRLRLPWGVVDAGLDLDGQAPFPLRATVRFKPGANKLLPALALTLNGELARLRLQTEASNPWLHARSAATLTPFAPLVLSELTANVLRLEGKRLDPRLPGVHLAGTLSLAQTHQDALTGRLELRNSIPGTLAEDRLPLTRLRAGLHLAPERLRLQDLETRLTGGGMLRGTLQLDRNGLNSRLSAHALDLHQLHHRLLPTRLAGHLELRADPATQRLQASLRDARQRYEIDATRRGDVIDVRQARLIAAGGQLDLSGRLVARGDWNFTTQARARQLNPARFGEFPEAKLNLDLDGSGQLQPDWKARVQARMFDSRFRDLPLSGNLRGTLSRAGLMDSHGDLSWGDNRVRFSGALGQPGDALDMDFNLSRLAQINRDWRGRIQGQGVLKGALPRPGIQISATADRIEGPGPLHIQSARVELDLAPNIDAPARIEARISQARVGGQELEDIHVHLDGSGRAHRASFKASGKGLAFDAELRGGLGEELDWRGQLVAFDLVHPRPARLAAPVDLAVSRDGVNLGPARLNALGAAFELDGLSWSQERLTSAGRFRGLPASLLELPVPLHEKEKVELAGDWRIAVGERLNGELNLWQDAGKWGLEGERRVHLAATQSRLRAVATDNRLNVTTHVELSDGSRLDANLATRVERRGAAWTLPATAPLQLSATGHLNDLRWLGRVLSQDLNTRGRLEFSGRAEGTWAKPNLAGHLNGSELAIKHLPSGVNLDAGKLAAHLEGDTLWIDEFTGKSGDGRLRAAGHARLAASPMLQLHVEGENLALLEHPDWNLDANLKGDLRLDAQGTAVDGEIRLNRSLMLLGGADAPTLSPDVRIKGRATQRASTAAPGLRLAVRLDLGDDCHIRSSDKGQLLGGRLPFQTSGLRAKITGAVHLDSAPGKPLSARGELKIADGHYYLLGQRLDIERGNVLFNGPLLDPVLDIEAVRETPRMKAGLGISGRARNPHTRLFSEPDVPDQEKLSWLLFGRGGQPVDSGISGTTGIATRLSSFGLQLTDKLYVAYEQGASGTENFVNFYSQLTDKLSVEARTGQESRLRLFYTFSLDSAE